MFIRTIDVNITSVSAEFDKMYDRWYGRHRFLLPSVLLGLVAIIDISIIILSILDSVGFQKTPIFIIDNTAISAVSGAYMWVFNDFIGRSRRLDFSPSDVMWGTLRLVISVPMGYSFAVLAPPVGLLIAFGLGAFPLTTLQTMLRQVTDKYLKIQDPVVQNNDDVSKLQGINSEIAERLYREGIFTIQQLAVVDPIQLVMKTDLSLEFIITCKSEAIARGYFDDMHDKLRPFGFRGALEVCNFIVALDAKSISTHYRAVAAFPQIAKVLNQSEETAYLVLRNVAYDQHTLFLGYLLVYADEFNPDWFLRALGLSGERGSFGEEPVVSASSADASVELDHTAAIGSINTETPEDGAMAPKALSPPPPPGSRRRGRRSTGSRP
jgi:hypothetical protein